MNGYWIDRPTDVFLTFVEDGVDPAVEVERLGHAGRTCDCDDGAVRPILGNQTGRPAVDKHTLYDWTAVSYTTHTHTVRLDSGQLHHTHTHCMTGQRSVTPHTHTL